MLNIVRMVPEPPTGVEPASGPYKWSLSSNWNGGKVRVAQRERGSLTPVDERTLREARRHTWRAYMRETVSLRGRPIDPGVLREARATLDRVGIKSTTLSRADRLAELADLPPGWLYGQGEAIQPSEIAWLMSLFAAMETLELPPPLLFPTPEGHVQAEWTFENGNMVEALFVDGKVECSVLTMDGLDYAYAHDLASSEAIARFVAFVRRFESACALTAS